MPRLTAVTITKNEEEQVERCLRSVQGLADEMVVVDAESTDRTTNIARRFTDKVFVRPWPGYGPQKNFALQQATGDWVLFVDADEEVTPSLAVEIRSAVSLNGQGGCHPERSEGSPRPRSFGLRPQDDKRGINVYFLRIITEFLGKPLTHLWGTNPRLLRRNAAAWDNREIHEQVVRPDGSTVRLGDPDVQLLHSPLNHPSHYDTLAAYRAKRERYTTRDAEEMRKTGHDRIGKPVGNPDTAFLARQRFLFERAVKQFVRLFLKKRGYLDGWRGLLWIWLSTQYEYLVSQKYLEKIRK